MRRFEYKDEKSDKFWEIEQTQNALTTRWGRIGTNGQSKTKDFADETAAQAAMEKQIDEKTGKGYQEVAVESGTLLKPAAKSAATPEPSAPKGIVNATCPDAPLPAPAPREAPTDKSLIPPWLKDKAEYIKPGQDFEPLPSRRNPGRPPVASRPFQEVLNTIANCYPPDPGISEPQHQAAVEESVKFLNADGDSSQISEEAAAILINLALSETGYDRNQLVKDDLLIHMHDLLGTAYFIRAVLKAEHLECYNSYLGRGRLSTSFISAHDTPLVSNGVYDYKFLTVGERIVRSIMAAVESEQWAAAEQAVLDGLDSLPLVRQPLMALIMPDSREIADRAARNLLAQSPTSFTVRALLLTALNPDLSRSAAEARFILPPEYSASCVNFLEDRSLADSLLAEKEEAALAGLLPGADDPHIGYLLAHINDPKAIEALALAGQKGNKHNLANTQLAIANWPRAAIAALGILIVDKRRDYTFLRPTFLNLCRQRPMISKPSRPGLMKRPPRRLMT